MVFEAIISLFRTPSIGQNVQPPNNNKSIHVNSSNILSIIVHYKKVCQVLTVSVNKRQMYCLGKFCSGRTACYIKIKSLTAEGPQGAGKNEFLVYCAAKYTSKDDLGMFCNAKLKNSHLGQLCICPLFLTFVISTTSSETSMSTNVCFQVGHDASVTIEHECKNDKKQASNVY